VTGAGESHVGVEPAVARGLGFLAGAAREADGLWQDFQLAPGPSTDWVSGFAAVAIAGVAPGAPEAQRAIAALTRRARRAGGWGYNEHVQIDGDSTAWGLLALAEGRQVSPLTVRKALDALVRHQGDTGGFATYISPDGPPARGAFRADWFAPQPCVTAAAVMALLAHGEPPDGAAIRNAAAFLARARCAWGGWSSCWWTGPRYPTYHAALVLGWLGGLSSADRDAIARATVAAACADGGWSDRGAELGEPFATALAIRTLLLGDPDPEVDAAIRRGVRWLVAAQCADGAWRSTPMLRVPDVTEHGIAGEFADDGRCFTTATVIGALDQAGRQPRDPDASRRAGAAAAPGRAAETSR
jgi:hypothetical protein